MGLPGCRGLGRREGLTPAMKKGPRELFVVGDRVLIQECRPISRHKKWRVIEILERHEVAELQPGEIAEPDIAPESVLETPPAAAPVAAEETSDAAAEGAAE